MPVYEYKCLTTGEIFEVIQRMTEDRLTEWDCPSTGKKEPCERYITGVSGIVFKGDGWSPNETDAPRGYRGKYKNKLRPVGTPVDAPAQKAEADRFFQQQVDNGMLDGVEPSMSVEAQTTEQMLDKDYKPKIK